MDIRITKGNVTYCVVCEGVEDAKKEWNDKQKSLVESGEQEEAVKFPGVPGYIIKDADDFKYSHSEICEECMHTLMRGVTVIHEQDLTGISLNSHR